MREPVFYFHSSLCYSIWQFQLHDHLPHEVHSTVLLDQWWVLCTCILLCDAVCATYWCLHITAFLLNTYFMFSLSCKLLVMAVHWRVHILPSEYLTVVRVLWSSQLVLNRITERVLIWWLYALIWIKSWYLPQMLIITRKGIWSYQTNSKNQCFL